VANVLPNLSGVVVTQYWKKILRIAQETGECEFKICIGRIENECDDESDIEGKTKLTWRPFICIFPATYDGDYVAHSSVLDYSDAIYHAGGYLEYNRGRFHVNHVYINFPPSSRDDAAQIVHIESIIQQLIDGDLEP
jgi:hypothetical protein